MNADAGRTYLKVMAVFYLGFGVATTFYPRLLQLFMTERGVSASTSFSDQVWLHGGLDILSICVLLFALSTVRTSGITLRMAAVVPLFPFAAIVYTFAATPFWNPLFLLPAAACLALTVYGLAISRDYATEPVEGAAGAE